MPPDPRDAMALIERYAEMERQRRAESQRVFGHHGASIPGLTFDWREEAETLEQQLVGAVADRDALAAAIGETLCDDEPCARCRHLRAAITAHGGQ
jgi:hypothetical protein